MSVEARFRVSHVLLDVDGTLVEYGDALRSALTVTAAEASTLAGSSVTPEELWEMRRTVMAEAAWQGAPAAHTRAEGLRRVLAVHGIASAEVIGRLMDSYAFTRDASMTVYADVPDALAALVALGVTLVAASNGDVDLSRVGIAHIEATHYASNLGVAKPDPRFFALASERFGVAPERMLMVGDRLDNDYTPARVAGLHAVLLDREDRVHDPEVTRITSLLDLPALIARFED